MEKIEFYDDESGDNILFEIVNSTEVDGNKYLLVVDEDDDATILKEMSDDEDNLVYELLEDEAEFQKVALLLMESDEYDIEIN